MFNNTTSSPLCSATTLVTFSIATSIIIAVLSPVAVAGNALILAAIWKKTFVRTTFHSLLSGLAFTDLCTGLVAQPFIAAPTLMYLANARVANKKGLLSTVTAIGESSAIYFISVTVLLGTLMSIERWLHMSRRSLTTSRRGCFTVTILSLIPIPTVVFCVLGHVYQKHRSLVTILVITLMFLSYLTTSFAYFKVYRIIRHHQHEVRASEASQNFGRQAIDLEKYKKSVASMMYIVLLFSFCFIPYIVLTGVSLSLEENLEMNAALKASVVLVFLSSSLNPGLYLWRMNDIRSGVKKLFCKEG
ncbi:high-affinity lysophosphatidic acid receptor-like [Oculina patagonica]